MRAKGEVILSKKGRAFNRLVAVVESKAVIDKTMQMSARMPLRLVQGIDRIARHRKTTRSAIIVLLLEAVLAELAAEGGEQVKKLLGTEAQEQRDPSRQRASC